MKNKLLVIALTLACALLTAAHLRVPHSAQSWRMDTSAARMRMGERMAVEKPAGDVDVNRASLAELDALYGVGPALAQAILHERQTNGWFYYPEDLLNVKGIGQITLKKMLRQLRLP